MNGFSKISPTDFPITCTTGYRFGFNGMEKDDEVKGVGNSLDFGARIYDSRLGRWLSTDPLQKKYPFMSPYAFCADNPIVYVDRDGRKIIIFYQDKNGKNTSYEYGSKQAVPNNVFVQQAVSTLNNLKVAGAGQAPEMAINKIASSTEKNLTIIQSTKGAFETAFTPNIQNKYTGEAIPLNIKFQASDAEINSGVLPFNPTAGLSNEEGTEAISPATAMMHEIGHAFGAFFQTDNFITRKYLSPDKQFQDQEERFATETFEHPVAQYNREWLRKDHSTGEEITTSSPSSNTPIVTNSDQLGQGKPIDVN